MTNPSTHHSPIPQRPWLLAVRVTWVMLCFVTVIIFVSAVQRTYVYYRDPQRWCAKASAEEQANCQADAQALREFGLPTGYFGIHSALGVIVEALPMILVGILIFSRKSRDLFGILFSLSVLVSGTVSFDSAFPFFFFQVWFGVPAMIAIGKFMVFLGGALLVVWYCFPDGRFVHRWTRWLAVFWVGISSASYFFAGSAIDINTWPESVHTGINDLFAISLAYFLIYRYQRVSDNVQRQQIKWVVATAALYVVILVLDPRPFVTDGLYMGYRDLFYTPLDYLSGAILATGIAFSILRYRLWDIDILINRTLVYGGLTVAVIGVYVLVVGVIGAVMQSNVNRLLAILATGFIAVLAQPLRDRLQRAVNRMMYGERDDPITVLSRLGRHLEIALAPDALLPSLVETIGKTLRIPYVAIQLGKGDTSQAQPAAAVPLSATSPAISFGRRTSEVICFPLVYQAENIGQLVVATRAVGEPFSRMDRHLLQNIARQAGMAVHAATVTTELQQARLHLVTASEEERRRLRRDLHDGLGPALASQGLKLAAAKQLLKSDPNSAASLLDQVMAQNQETVGDVRRLVYGLRPPVLDERGLAEAIRDYVWQDSDETQGLRLEVMELPAELRSLPAAVEVAAYRIALEALTNSIRHANARTCTVRFALREDGWARSIQVEIADDGIGLPNEPHAGVGLRSMRERAEELGGRLTIESVPHGGTHVVALLPLGSPTPSNDLDELPANHNQI